MKCRYVKLNTFEEYDGKLSVAEVGKDIPFEIKRVFFIHCIPSSNVIRGNHASRNTEFFLQAVVGHVCIELFDGESTFKIDLDKINTGLYVPKMVWIRATSFSLNAILQVYASNTYEKCEYIDDINELIR